MGETITGAVKCKNATSTALETNRVVSAVPAVVYGLTGANTLAGAQFIQLHDAVALPADTAVPVCVFSAAASSTFSIDFGVYGRVFTNGVVICNSTTAATKTIGAANCFFDVQYR